MVSQPMATAKSLCSLRAPTATPRFAVLSLLSNRSTASSSPVRLTRLWSSLHADSLFTIYLRRFGSMTIRQYVWALALLLALLVPKAARAAYFDDKTSVNFPAPACVVEATQDDPDYPAKRLG